MASPGHSESWGVDFQSAGWPRPRDESHSRRGSTHLHGWFRMALSWSQPLVMQSHVDNWGHIIPRHSSFVTASEGGLLSLLVVAYLAHHLIRPLMSLYPRKGPFLV